MTIMEIPPPSSTKQGIRNIASMAYGFGLGSSSSNNHHEDTPMSRSAQSAGDLRKDLARPRVAKVNSFSQSLLNARSSGKKQSLSPFREKAFKALLGGCKNEQEEDCLFHRSFSGVPAVAKDLTASSSDLHKSITDIYGFIEERRARSTSRSPPNGDNNISRDRSESRGRRRNSKSKTDRGRSGGSRNRARNAVRDSQSPSKSRSPSKDDRSQSRNALRRNSKRSTSRNGGRARREDSSELEGDRSQSASSIRKDRIRRAGSSVSNDGGSERDRSQSKKRRPQRTQQLGGKAPTTTNTKTVEERDRSQSATRKIRAVRTKSKEMGDSSSRSNSSSRARKAAAAVATEQMATALGPAPTQEPEPQEEWVAEWEDPSITNNNTNPLAVAGPATTLNSTSERLRSRVRSKENTKATRSGIQPGVYRSMIQS